MTVKRSYPMKWPCSKNTLTSYTSNWNRFTGIYTGQQTSLLWAHFPVHFKLANKLRVKLVHPKDRIEKRQSRVICSTAGIENSSLRGPMSYSLASTLIINAWPLIRVGANSVGQWPLRARVVHASSTVWWGIVHQGNQITTRLSDNTWQCISNLKHHTFKSTEDLDLNNWFSGFATHLQHLGSKDTMLRCHCGHNHQFTTDEATWMEWVNVLSTRETHIVDYNTQSSFWFWHHCRKETSLEPCS